MKRAEWEKLRKKYEEYKQYSERPSVKEKNLIDDFNCFVKSPVWISAAKEKLDELKDYIED